MIFRSVVYAMVVAMVASASIKTPTYPSTTPHHELLTNTTSKPTDTMATVKPAVNIITTVKSAAPVPAQAPMISCYCNLPECSVAAGGDGTCSTRLGCYSEVQPIIPGIEEEIVTPAKTVSNNTANGSAASPIVSEFEVSPVDATTEHASAIRGSFGCLDQLNFAKQSCDEILKSMEAEASEFPIIQVPTNKAAPSAMNDGVHAFHCCQTERCNGNQSGPAEGSVKSAQAVLVAELKNTVAPQVIKLGGQNSTVWVPWTPAVSSSVNSSAIKADLFDTKPIANNVESASNAYLFNSKSIVNNVESAIAKRSSSPGSDTWNVYIGTSIFGEPAKAPSAFHSGNSFKDASLINTATPAIPDVVPPTSPVDVPDKQEINNDKTVSHDQHLVDLTIGISKHVVFKRHDGQKVTPMLKRTVDDQENISDFDDDIAAEVAAAMATAKTPVLVTQEGAVTMSSEWAPRHSGVPDFSPPPPVLQKRNSTSTNSYSPVQGVDNLSNQYTTHTANNDSDLSISKIGIICAIVGLCVLGLSVLMVFVLKNIINDTDVFSNYKGVCSNPGLPCACRGGRPSSSNPEAAAAAVNRNTCSTAPLLPPPNSGHRTRRGHANPGAMYNDSTGDATYVFTPIPAVVDNLGPVRVVRR